MCFLQKNSIKLMLLLSLISLPIANWDDTHMLHTIGRPGMKPVYLKN